MDPKATDPRVSTGSKKPGSYWSRFHRKINHVAENFFYRLGYWVATHPKRTLFISTVLVIACCFGFANFTAESDSEDLWVPADSLSKKHQAIIDDAFQDDDGEFATFLATSPSISGNIVTKEGLDALWDLDDIVMAVESGGKTYADLCAKELDGVTCQIQTRGVTRFWGNDRPTYEASVTTDADVLAAVNVDAFPDGQAVNHAALFGNSIEYDDEGSIIGARAMFQAYGLASDQDDDADINDEVFDWNGEFQDTMEESAPDFAGVLSVFYLTSRSVEDALDESVSGEAFLYVATYLVMIIVVAVALGRCCSGPVNQRTWLGPGGVLIVIAAALAAYGLNSAFEIPFTSLSAILPFILVGIGVDDMFVIVAAFDHTDPSLPVVERVALGVKRCGVSITYTSLTNFFAFLLGTLTSLPAVEYFCNYASTAILFNFVLQMTAFVAMVTMDANRQEAGRIDWCCCFTCKSHLEEQQGPERRVDLSGGGAAAARGVGNKGGRMTGRQELAAEVHELSAVGRFMKDKYTPLLLSTAGKVLVLLGSASLLAAGIYGVVNATRGFDVLDLAPDDHYSRDYTETARSYDLDIAEWYVPVNVVTREVDYTDVTVQAEIQATDDRMLEQSFVSGPVTSWLVSFVEWAGNSTEYSGNVGTSGGYPVYEDSATFYTAVSEFVQDGENAWFQSDVVFKDDGTIEISRSEMYLIDLTDTTKNIDALEGTREVAQQSALDPDLFGFSGLFVFTEQDLVIYDELLSSFGLALVAVLALSLLVLGKIAVVVLVCLTVLIIDVELLGFVYHWGLDVNSITAIELIMAVGLVVDYMVHIVHYFLHQDPSTSKDARIANALGEIGPSILVGAATTFLGIVSLAFASNAIFRIFFQMFLIIISFGFFHGAVFIPVMLSILPDGLVSPASSHDDGPVDVTAEDEDADQTPPAAQAFGFA